MTAQTRRRIATRVLGDTSVFPYGPVRRPARSAPPPVGRISFRTLLRELVRRVRADAGDRERLGDPAGDARDVLEGRLVERLDGRVRVDVLAEDDRLGGG